jgi:hypothetical protein
MWQYRYVLFIHHMVLWVIPFKRKSVYIDAHGDQAQGYIFWLTVVVDSRLCQLYCRRLVCMIDSSNVLWFCPDLKGTCVCLNRA